MTNGSGADIPVDVFFGVVFGLYPNRTRIFTWKNVDGLHVVSGL